MNKAIDVASWSMIKFLEEKKSMTSLDAYGLVSLAMDCRIGTISNTEKNIHCLLSKSMWQ
jgi:acetamidase/formamidase